MQYPANYNELWQQWLEHENIMEKAEHQFGALYKEVVGVNPTIASRHSWQTMAKSLINDLVVKAKKDFGIGPHSQIIDERELAKIAAYDRAYTAKEFNPQKVWDWLETTYGGQAGAEKVQQEAAIAAARGLWLRRHPPVPKKGGIEMEVSINTEKSMSGTSILSYHSAENLADTMAALDTFCQWAGINSTTTLVEAAKQAGLNYYGNVTSRKECHLAKGFILTTYLSKVVYWMDAAMAKQFKVWISLYAMEYLNQQ